MTGPYGPPTGGAPGIPPGGQGSYPPAGAPPYQQQGAPQFQQAGPPAAAPWGQPGGWAPGQQPAPGRPGGLGPAGAPSAPRQPVDLTRMAPLAVAVLGVLNFIWGFLPSISIEGDVPDSFPRSVYAIGPGYLSILLLAAGLLALGALLPNAVRVQFPVAVVSVASAIGVIVVGFITGSLFDVAAAVGGGSGPGVGKGIGLILLLIFGILQAVAAVAWWVMDARPTAGGSRPGGSAAWNAASSNPTPSNGAGGHAPQVPAGGAQQAAAPGYPAEGGGYGQPAPAYPQNGPDASHQSYGQSPSAPGAGFGAEPYHPAGPATPGAPANEPGPAGPTGGFQPPADPGPDDNPEETRQLRF